MIVVGLLVGIVLFPIGYYDGKSDGANRVCKQVVGEDYKVIEGYCFKTKDDGSYEYIKLSSQ